MSRKWSTAECKWRSLCRLKQAAHDQMKKSRQRHSHRRPVARVNCSLLHVRPWSDDGQVHFSHAVTLVRMFYRQAKAKAATAICELRANLSAENAPVQRLVCAIQFSKACDGRWSHRRVGARSRQVSVKAFDVKLLVVSAF